MSEAPHDPALDLVLDRVIAVPRDLVWRAWTEPELVKRWFAPAPWTTVACAIDLRPGGAFRTVMRSPEGQEFANAGCYLEIVEGEKLVFTDALSPGYRPAPTPFFTAIVTFADDAGGTRYTARTLHKDEADRKRHEDMGFADGWSRCADQLVAAVAPLRG